MDCFFALLVSSALPGIGRNGADLRAQATPTRVSKVLDHCRASQRFFGGKKSAGASLPLLSHTASLLI
jgi:hypothetical protein